MLGTRANAIDKLLSSVQESFNGNVNYDMEEEKPQCSIGRRRLWTNENLFVEDNLMEVYMKLPNLEKQIWGKLIVMEKNRRTAKAYLRHTVITVDGIGLSRFENCERSTEQDEIYAEIEQGIKIKIDPDGNVWAKRMCRCPVYLKPLYRNRQDDLFAIEQRPIKVFDIKLFKDILVRELRKKLSRPNRARLEKCCLVCLKFDIDHPNLLSTPCWIIIVHLIAIELLNMLLPKDNDFSSPSSSFILEAGPDLRISPSFSNEQEGGSFSPNRNRRRLNTKGGVFKKIVRCSEPFLPPSRINTEFIDDYDNMRSFEHDSRRRSVAASTSLVDLRQINKFFSPVYFERKAVDRVSRGGEGHDKCTPLSSVHSQMKNRQYMDARKSILLEAQMRQNIKRWRSQDSGIGSGGTVNSK